MILTWKWPQRIHGKHYLKLCRSLGSNEIKDLNSEKNLKHYECANNGYVTVYKFPYIKHAFVLSKLKKYQMYLTATGIPILSILAQQGIIVADAIPATIYYCVGMYTLFFTTSLMSRNLIGFIYFNKEKNQVKVAYLDFWGNRREKEMQLTDIIPLSESGRNYLTDYLYTPFQQFSDKE
ncbi:hypothetical protein WA026_010958, partial [Henosepilachna vigintioctopunctata]